MKALFSSIVMSPPSQHTTKAEKTEPNGRAMSKVMTMFNGHGRGQNSVQPKTPLMACCVQSPNLLITNVAMSQIIDLILLGLVQVQVLNNEGLEQALRLVV
jgi:hypothetical protein